MDPVITIPTSCEIYGVICFFLQIGQSTAEIYHQLCHVYNDNVMCDGSGMDLCRKFRDGHADALDEDKKDIHL